MYNKKIPVEDLQYLFDRILCINYFIKRRDDLIIRKSPLYAMKSHLVYYTINAILRNYYQINDIANSTEVSYKIEGIQTQADNAKSLVLFKFIIGDKEYKCHQIIEGRLKQLLSNDISNAKIIGEYERAENEIYDSNITNDELVTMWYEINDKVHELCWSILHFIDTCTWANIMTSHYQNIKIRTVSNKWQNNSEGFIRRGNRKTGTKTPNVNFKYMRHHFTLMLKQYFNDEIIMNYSLKTEG